MRAMTDEGDADRRMCLMGFRVRREEKKEYNGEGDLTAMGGSNHGCHGDGKGKRMRLTLVETGKVN